MQHYWYCTYLFAVLNELFCTKNSPLLGLVFCFFCGSASAIMQRSVKGQLEHLISNGKKTFPLKEILVQGEYKVFTISFRAKNGKIHV